MHAWLVPYNFSYAYTGTILFEWHVQFLILIASIRHIKHIIMNRGIVNEYNIHVSSDREVVSEQMLQISSLEWVLYLSS